METSSRSSVSTKEIDSAQPGFPRRLHRGSNTGSAPRLSQRQPGEEGRLALLRSGQHQEPGRHGTDKQPGIFEEPLVRCIHDSTKGEVGSAAVWLKGFVFLALYLKTMNIRYTPQYSQHIYSDKHFKTRVIKEQTEP